MHHNLHLTDDFGSTLEDSTATLRRSSRAQSLDIRSQDALNDPRLREKRHSTELLDVPPEVGTVPGRAKARRDERVQVKVRLSKLNDKGVREFEGLVLVQRSTLPSVVRTVRFSPNGISAAVGGDDGYLELFSVSEGADPLTSRIKWTGHAKMVLEISWSPSSTHLISASMDKTAMLWSIDSEAPLMCFQHPDIVTSVHFHPINSNFFVTVSLDRTLRVWCIPNNRVETYVQGNAMLTACRYSPRGDLVFAGTLEGFVNVYSSPSLSDLRLVTKLSCRNRKGFKRKGKKVTGIEFLDDTHVLISNNDSRMRLFSLQDFALKQKYKGLVNEETPIKSSFSHNFMHVISGSDTGEIFIWNQLNSYAPRDKCWYRIFNRDRNSSFESFKAGRAKVVTCALFGPVEMLRRVQEGEALRGSLVSHIVVATNSECRLKVWLNKYRV
jgi:WD40 repeat protein